MTLVGSGKAILSDFKCAHCGYNNVSLVMQDTWHCAKCGARYQLTKYIINSCGKIKCEYDMTGFNCIQSDYWKKCGNTCPAPYMYCEAHSDTKHLDKAKEAIADAKNRVKDVENIYKLIEESRKTWMVTKLSGIDDE